MLDALIIGGGITGCTVAKSFLNQNRKVMIIDDDSNLAGSKASGGHFMKSWVSGLPTQDYDKSVERLDDLWGVTDEKYMVYPKKKLVTVSRLSYSKVRDNSIFTIGRVTKINKDEEFPVVTYKGLHNQILLDVKTRLLVVCAGVWSSELLHLDEKIQSKKGVAFKYDMKLKRPFIKPWAPYKQVVGHQETKSTVWIGDGSSILEKNWSRKRTSECWERCSNHLGLENQQPTEVIHGLRPYCKSGNDPCICKQVKPNIWIVTGAGKLGTISSGWASNILLQATS
jgi:glycine/D-amino acid oxidase-like deaminating enzyme